MNAAARLSPAATSRRNFAAIRSGHYELYEKLLLNMLNHLSGLLRMTAGVVRESGDAIE